MKRFLVVFCTIMVIVTALWGYSLSTPSIADAAEAQAGGKTPKDIYKDEIKIAWLCTNPTTILSGAWHIGIEQGLQLALFPNIKLQMFDGKSSAETQSQQVQDVINQQYDAILLEAWDAAALAAAVRQAEDAGIPVIGVNQGVDTTQAALVAMIDYEAGCLIAEEIAKGLTGKEGNVAIIQAPPGAQRGILLESGFRDTLAKYPNLTIIDAQDGAWITEQANTVMRDMLTKYEKIDAVFCHNDAMARGASQAAEAAGRLEEILIWGADGEKLALEYIEQGKMTGTIYTNGLELGSTSAKFALYLIASGIDTSKYVSTPVIKASYVVATKDTVGTIPASSRF